MAHKAQHHPHLLEDEDDDRDRSDATQESVPSSLKGLFEQPAPEVQPRPLASKMSLDEVVVEDRVSRHVPDETQFAKPKPKHFPVKVGFVGLAASKSSNSILDSANSSNSTPAPPPAYITRHSSPKEILRYLWKWAVPGPRDLLAGLIAFIIGLSVIIIASFTLFSSDRLLPHIGSMFSMQLLGQVVVGITHLFWDVPFPCPAPDVFSVPFMLPMIETLSTAIENDDEFYATVMFMFIFSHVCMGSITMFAGMFQQFRLSDFVPYPVVCGLLAGLGGKTVQIVVNLVLKDVNLPYLKLLICLCFAYAFVTGQRNRPIISLPLLFIGSVGLFHIGRISLGASIADAQEMTWMYTPETLKTKQVPYPWLLDLGMIHYSKVFNEWPTILGMTVMYMLKTVLLFPGFEKLIKMPVSVKVGLRCQGFVAFASGLLNLMPGFTGPSTLNVVVQISPRPWLPSVITTLLFLLCFGGSMIQHTSFVPQFFFSGLLIASFGLLLYNWSVKSRSRLPKSEWAVVLFIAFVSTFYTMIMAVAIGGFFSILLFAHSMFRVECVKFHASGLTLRSTIDRSLDQKDKLDRVGDHIQVLQLQGYIFFGNASNVLLYVKSMPTSLPAFRNTSVPTFVIIDLPFVLGLDASAVDVFSGVIRVLEPRAKVFFSGASDLVKEMLLFRSGGVIKAEHLFSNLDAVLEHCEDILLKPSRKEQRQMSIMLENTVPSFDKALSIISHRFGVETEALLGLKPYLRVVELTAGAILMEQRAGTPVVPDRDGLFFVESGSLRIERNPDQSLTLRSHQLELKHTRIQNQLQKRNAKKQLGIRNRSFRLSRIGAGWVIGAHEYFSGFRSVGVFVAETDSRLHFMTFQQVQELEQSNPLLCAQLYRVLGRLVSEALDRNSDQLCNVMDMMYTFPSSTKALLKVKPA